MPVADLVAVEVEQWQLNQFSVAHLGSRIRRRGRRRILHVFIVVTIILRAALEALDTGYRRLLLEYLLVVAVVILGLLLVLLLI